MFVKVYSGACVGVYFTALSWSKPHDSFKVNEKVTARMACDNLKICPLLLLRFSVSYVMVINGSQHEVD